LQPALSTMTNVDEHMIWKTYGDLISTNINKEFRILNQNRSFFKYQPAASNWFAWKPFYIQHVDETRKTFSSCHKSLSYTGGNLAMRDFIWYRRGIVCWRQSFAFFGLNFDTNSRENSRA
jgi:hypothetical protein